MTPFRTVIFWMHLATGVAGGIVILIMSVTGVALTYEKQMLEWADRQSWSAPSSTDVPPLPPETLLTRVVEARPGTAPASLTLRSDPLAPATLTLEGNTTVLVDPYRGMVIGEPAQGLRSFFRTMTTWHRYLSLEGASRTTGKAITGAANLGFLFIVISGLYLWLPKVRNAIQFKNILWFRRGLPGKARDFNWHNVVGFWSAIPLAVVVAGAVPISYPWASNLVYRVVGETPPPRVQRPPTRASANEPNKPAPTPRASAPRLEGLNAAWRRAEQQMPAWRTISLRLAGSPEAPWVFTIDEGYAGQPQKRGTLTLDRGSADVLTWETFDSLSAGRRLRSWLRFAHTGEIYGLTGQTIAGIVSAGGVVLVYTGLALACRRSWSWLIRRRRKDRVAERKQAA